ncbi:recombinase RecT [Sulfurimonas sp. NW9]|uniref:recombinase RecT n=1 Tax=Sulfurimonas sp. NW9 TaxID=2922728 RepID=UPI003DA9D8B6
MGALTQNFNGANPPQQGGNGGIAEVLEGKKDFFVAFYGESGYKRAMETAIAIATDSKFDRCSPISIAEAIMASVRVGLDIELGEAWLVPYKETVQFQIGRKGFQKLLYNSAAGWLIDAEPVYDTDSFEYQITEQGKKITFTPNFFEREEDSSEWIFGHMKAIYLSATDKSGRKIHKVVTKKQIEKLRLNSPNQIYASKWAKPDVKDRIAKKLPVEIWQKWYGEMAITKAIKLFAKQLPIGDKVINKAIKLDDLAEVGEQEEFIAEAQTIEPTPLPQQTTIQPDPKTPTSINDIKAQAAILGAEVSGPVEKHGKFWVKAITSEHTDTQLLQKLGFIFISHKNVWVMEVTHLI